jgi:hypothetical protein
MRAVILFACTLVGFSGAFEGSPAPGPTTPVEKHWAFKMPKAGTRSIDPLIDENLQKAGLAPNSQAPREVLIRRAFHVLTGLLPTASELQKILNDNREDWLSHLIDDLLSRPAYGERWGRHWLDIARYADTRGAALPRNEDFPFAYTYRDWIIRSLNEDLPYNEFIHRQIAADLMPDLPREELAALGFLTVGRGYQGGQNHLVIADRIDVSTRSIMGLTVACARCHDHKTDPIPTADYYGLFGVFNSSFVPNQLPAIAEPSATPEAKAYRDTLLKKALAIHEHVSKIVPEYQTPEDPYRFSLPGNIRGRLNQVQNEKFQTLIGQFEQFRASSPHALPRAMVLREKNKPFDPRIHERGNPRAQGEPVPRAFLSLFREKDEQFKNGSGRLEFAHRLTDDRNPLTARVWANRVWMHLTGSPLVDSPGDFGPQTPEPLQLALLDHLALFLKENHWSTKALMKHIMVSATWQRDSTETSVLRENDPANHYYARANRRRKDLESWRDTILQASGRLDRAIGGKPFELDRPPFPGRRTVYARIRRGFLPPIMRAFDFPGSEEALMKRSNTITPTQALYLMNSPFLRGEARALAAKHSSVTSLYQAVLGRKPTSAEKERATSWLARARNQHTAGSWSYGFVKKNSSTFVCLPHFQGGQWRGKEPLPDPVHGWLHWNSRGGHPEADRHAVLKWTAIETGKVKISGEVHVPTPKGNGVIARIMGPNGAVLGKWTIDPGKKSATSLADVSIQAGEEISFVIESRDDPSFDSFHWAPRISDERGLFANAATDFSGPGLPPLAQLAQALVLSNEFFYLD